MKLQSLDLFNFINQYEDMPSDLSKVKSVVITATADGEAKVKITLIEEIKEEIESVVDSIEEFFGSGNPVPDADIPKAVSDVKAKVQAPVKEIVETPVVETPVLSK